MQTHTYTHVQVEGVDELRNAINEQLAALQEAEAEQAEGEAGARAAHSRSSRNSNLPVLVVEADLFEAGMLWCR